jgi:hypothetical protein
MQACAEPLAFERKLFGEAFADDPQDGHLAVGPFDTFAAGSGQPEIAHIVPVALGIGHKNPPANENPSAIKFLNRRRQVD